MCGFVGLVASQDVAPQIHLALQALQHRGQDSAGIATMSGDGRRFAAQAGRGAAWAAELVSHVGLAKDDDARKERASSFSERRRGK